MPKPVFHEFTAPSEWAPYLINGDASGLSDQEQSAVDEWLEWVGMIGPVGCSADEEFRWRHDAFNVWPLGGMCLTYLFQEKVSEPS